MYEQLLLSVIGAFAEFERSLIRERQREGIALAKKAGVYKGRKPSLTERTGTAASRKNYSLSQPGYQTRRGSALLR
jgi:DNA invertase Pin-like site-specific DNA recombinase